LKKFEGRRGSKLPNEAQIGRLKTLIRRFEEQKQSITIVWGLSTTMKSDHALIGRGLTGIFMTERMALRLKQQHIPAIFNKFRQLISNQ
jgi:hypothetical protein